MEYSDFYLMNDKDLRGALNVSDTDQVTNPGAILRHEFIPPEPIIWHRNIGSTPKDCISTGWVTLFLFSERVFNLFEEFGFTGWDTYPCVVYGKNKELIPGYKGLSIAGSCGILDHTLRHQEMRYSPIGKLRPIWVGWYFDLKTWDGSDFFVPKESEAVLVTERVKKAVEKAKFTNIEFENITTIESLV